ncbi:hypothetical protein EG834_05755 [bacterium]|nr:hypothetical protein [bacterium]
MCKSSLKQAAVLPLGIKDRQKTELPALVALTAIGEPWFSTQHQLDLLAVALVVGEMAPAGSQEARCAAELQRLCGGQTVSLDCKVEIALALAECLPWLQLQPNHKIQRALKTLMDRQYLVAA